MRLIFIRHGQTTGDVEDRYGGDYDDHLTPEGLKQAEQLAEELKDKSIEVLVTSPLIRARETAEVLAEKRGAGVTYEPRIRERNQYGILTGKVKSEAKQQFPQLVENLKDRYNTIEGAELYEDFRDRVKEAFNDLTKFPTHKCAGVIWHGGPMRVLFRDILKKGELGKEIGDCAWVELEKKGDEFVIKDSRRIEFPFTEKTRK